MQWVSLEIFAQRKLSLSMKIFLRLFSLRPLGYIYIMSAPCYSARSDIPVYLFCRAYQSIGLLGRKQLLYLFCCIHVAVLGESHKVEMFHVGSCIVLSSPSNQTIIQGSDVDPDPVGFAFILVPGSGAGSRGIK